MDDKALSDFASLARWRAGTGSPKRIAHLNTTIEACSSKVPQLSLRSAAQLPNQSSWRGLTVAPKKRGIYADPAGTATAQLQDKVADFSYQSDALAQLIVDMWTGAHSDLLKAPNQNDYLPRSANAKAAFAARGIYLKQPIVVTEDEYDAGFSLADAGLTVAEAVVLVLPRDRRATGATTTGGPPLLETAKMLMAITPNGI